MHTARCLYTTTFHCGFKTATSALFNISKIQLQWLGPGSNIALVTVRQLFPQITYLGPTNSGNYPCQLAPAECQGFLLLTFQTAWAVIFSIQAGQLTKYWRAVEFEITETLSTVQACSFFLGILPLDPRFCQFFHYLVSHVCLLITFKIQVHCFGTRDTLKKMICLSISQALFSLVMQFSHESEHSKLKTSLIINLLLSVFYGKSLSCEVIDKNPGWPQFFQQ